MSRARLRLDQVWLLVSPGNPLKPVHGMAPMAKRLASAHGIADGRRIIATSVEAALGTRFTVDTLKLLCRRFPRAHFVWLMGADNLMQLPRWRRWLEIVTLMPFAVLPRPTYNPRALAGRASRRLRVRRLPARAGHILALQSAPAWLFLPVPQNHASATALRQQNSGENR